jgi:GT2 family glycosyltransferase
MPFAGDAAAAQRALAALRTLRVRAGDELILADNSGCVAPAAAERVRVVAARGERSPSHARNVGAAAAGSEWLLFLDADTRPRADLLDRYFDTEWASGVGAVAGEVHGPASPAGLAARYGAHKNFLSQTAHLAHPFRPRASTANLLVRRAALTAAGGFTEGIRAAEDTDFCWRLQDLGWTLALAAEAWVEHDYRDSVRALRRQWREYAAGRAWLAARHPGFRPEPALTRRVRRLRRRGAGDGPGTPAASPRSALERAQFAALDVILGIDELIGLRRSNRL